MVNKILSFLYTFRRDGYFYDLTPLLEDYKNIIPVTDVSDLAMAGLIEANQVSSFIELTDTAEVVSRTARITEKGIYYLEGNQKILDILEAIEAHDILHLIYTNPKGRRQSLTIEPYVYGRDSEDRQVLWGFVTEYGFKDVLFPLDSIILEEEPLAKFEAKQELKLLQPEGIGVISEVEL